MNGPILTKSQVKRILEEAKNATRNQIEPSRESVDKIERQYPHASPAEKWRLAQADTFIASMDPSRSSSRRTP